MCVSLTHRYRMIMHFFAVVVVDEILLFSRESILFTERYANKMFVGSRVNGTFEGVGEERTTTHCHVFDKYACSVWSVSEVMGVETNTCI